MRHHGQLRGLDRAPVSSNHQGRFGRLFRTLPAGRWEPSHLVELAEKMIGEGPEEDQPLGMKDEEENDRIPAGYTYLGQFIDHDLTFDPASSFEQRNDPDSRTNFRTPRFDLDNLYGRGPADQPYLYREDGVRFALGSPLSDPEDKRVTGFDLPRFGEERDESSRALIGDPRNDENRIVASLHSVLLQFHNKLADAIEKKEHLAGEALFQAAQNQTRWHYQWVVLHDLLPRIVGEDLLAELLSKKELPGTGGRTWRSELAFFNPRRQPFIPVEFSAAAYRMGHSMVRPSYHFNLGVGRANERAAFAHKPEPKGPFRTPIFSKSDDFRGHLGGFRRIPSDWAFQWKLFFGSIKREPARNEPFDKLQTQPSYKIDTLLSDPLTLLADPRVRVVSDGPGSLAERNLRRGMQLGLPSGQDVARAMGLPPLERQLFDDDEGGHKIGSQGKPLGAGARAALVQSTPLWFYILREAELLQKGTRLGPVGARIVAETFVGLLIHDPACFLRVEPNWRPMSKEKEFGMPELIQFATGQRIE